MNQKMDSGMESESLGMASGNGQVKEEKLLRLGPKCKQDA